MKGMVCLCVISDIKPDSKTKGAQALTIISVSEIFFFLKALIFAYQQDPQRMNKNHRCKWKPAI